MTPILFATMLAVFDEQENEFCGAARDWEILLAEKICANCCGSIIFRRAVFTYASGGPNAGRCRAARAGCDGISDARSRRSEAPNIFLIGDFTVRNGAGDGSNGQWGWGEPFVEFFDAAKINVVNRALQRTQQPHICLTEGHWDPKRK